MKIYRREDIYQRALRAAATVVFAVGASACGSNASTSALHPANTDGGGGLPSDVGQKNDVTGPAADAIVASGGDAAIVQDAAPSVAADTATSGPADTAAPGPADVIAAVDIVPAQDAGSSKLCTPNSFTCKDAIMLLCNADGSAKIEKKFKAKKNPATGALEVTHAAWACIGETVVDCDKTGTGHSTMHIYKPGAGDQKDPFDCRCPKPMSGQCCSELGKWCQANFTPAGVTIPKAPPSPKVPDSKKPDYQKRLAAYQEAIKKWQQSKAYKDYQAAMAEYSKKMQPFQKQISECQFGPNYDGSKGCTPWGPPVPPAYDIDRVV